MMKNRFAGLLLLFFFIASQACAGQSAATRWKIADDSGIVWTVTEDRIPHADHIEMSGEMMSLVLYWEIDAAGTFHAERSLVFPMLRTVPNNTHASFKHRLSLDIPGRIRVNEMPLGGLHTESVEINGALTAISAPEVGKSLPPLRLTSTFFPSRRDQMMYERYQLENLSDRELQVTLPALDSVFTPEKVVFWDGPYLIDVKSVGAGTFAVPPGGQIQLELQIRAYRQREAQSLPTVPSVEEAYADRMDFVGEVSRNLVLDCPDPTINTMFRFAKIRAAESIFKTKGGYMHSPGGESYYAAIWANDQAEYINAFFPFLGYGIGNESARNSFRHFARYMNDGYLPIPSSIIAEGDDFWNGVGDRGDAAMIAYGASRFALAAGDAEIGRAVWPLIEWCLEYCRRKLNAEGVVASDTDELENRFESGDANLCTSCLYYDALKSAVHLSGAIGADARDYAARAEAMRRSIESYFGADVRGFHTYRYYDGNDMLRSWICIPLTVGIYDRAEETTAALFSPLLWSENGLLTEQGQKTYWDRSTLYALRGVFAAGKCDDALEKLASYSATRLLGDHVPYAVEAWPEGFQRHLSAESGLYCRIITEGLFGIRPTGIRSFDLKPSMPSSWKRMTLRHVRAFGSDFDIEVKRRSPRMLNVTVRDGKSDRRFRIRQGTTITYAL